MEVDRRARSELFKWKKAQVELNSPSCLRKGVIPSDSTKKTIKPIKMLFSAPQSEAPSQRNSIRWLQSQRELVNTLALNN